MIIYESAGYFSMWDYRVSLQVLLLRDSTLKHEKYTNTDIMFIGVFYINIPTYLKGLSISELSEEDYSKFDIPYKEKLPDEKFFIVMSEGKEYIIGALSLSVYYNRLNHTKSSIRLDLKDKFLVATSA